MRLGNATRLSESRSAMQCDCFDVAKIQSYGYHFSKIFIDISGSRDLKILFPLIECYTQVLKPQVDVSVDSSSRRHTAAALVLAAANPTPHTLSSEALDCQELQAQTPTPAVRHGRGFYDAAAEQLQRPESCR